MKYKDILFLFLGIGGWIIVFITMIWALFHDFWYAFHINKYGEAWLDILIVVIILIFMVIYLVQKIIR